MQKVVVYRFEVYDINADHYVWSRRRATLGAIAAVSGRADLRSGMDVDESELDDNGMTRPGYSPPRSGFQQHVDR